MSLPFGHVSGMLVAANGSIGTRMCIVAKSCSKLPEQSTQDNVLTIMVRVSL